MAFVIWYEKKLEGFFYLSIFLMAFAVWTRSDAVMFIGAILAVLAWYSYRTKTYKFLLQYLVALVPFVAWNLYSKSYIPRDQTGFFIKKIFFDGDKLGKVLSSAWGIMSSSNIYGLTFYIFIIGLLVNVMAIIKRDKWELLSIFFIALTGYTMLFYQMSDADGSLFPPGGWMQSGYKRGLFCYAPLALFYVSVSKYVRLGFDKLHQRLNLFTKS